MIFETSHNSHDFFPLADIDLQDPETALDLCTRGVLGSQETGYNMRFAPITSQQLITQKLSPGGLYESARQHARNLLTDKKIPFSEPTLAPDMAGLDLPWYMAPGAEITVSEQVVSEIIIPHLVTPRQPSESESFVAAA